MVKRVSLGVIVFTFLAFFDVFAVKPVIASLTKTDGPVTGGTYVGILGENFTKATYFLFGDNRVVTKRYVNSTLVYVMTVENPRETVNIKAYTPGSRSSTLRNAFTFTNNGPVLDHINLNNGPAEGNTIVHYYGQNFTSTMAIKFGENESTKRYFYHSDRMYSYTPLTELEEGSTSKTVDISVAVDGNADLLDDAYTFQKDTPIITKISPAEGIKQGGTLLKVWGRNFRATDRWYIGGNEVQFYIPNYHHQFKYGHSSYVLLKTEAAGDLSVGTPLDLKVEPVVEDVLPETKTGCFTYMEDAPEFTTVYPNSGFAVGSTVYIRGKNISQDIVTNFLKLEGEAVSEENQGQLLYYYHDGLVRVKTPARSVESTEGDLVDVRMENANGWARNFNGFTYLDLAPRISYISPNNGVATGNQYVYIRGRNFTDDDMSVAFSSGSDPSVYRIYRSDLMAIKTVPSVAGSVNVTVTSAANGSAYLNGGYVYTENNPRITSIWPLADTTDGNRNLYLYGVDFTPSSTVQFGVTGDPIEISYFYHAGKVRVKTPDHEAGKVDLKLNTEYGSFEAEKAYRFRETTPTYDPGTPIITRVSPLSGTMAGGTYVYLYGTNLTKDTTVSFNGQPANITHVHSTGRRLTILTPAVGTVGSVDIETVNIVDDTELDFALEDGFTYTQALPVISLIRPAKGFLYGGTYVYLYGENLTSQTELYLGGQKATLKKFYHSRLARYMTSPSSSTGLVDLDVESQFGNASLESAFQYAEFSPEVSSITPNHGSTAGGNWIRIYGSFFTPSTKVYVDDVQVPEEQVRYYHTRYLIAKAPANATDNYKTVNIKVETEYGSVTNKDAYTYVHPDVQLSF